MCSQRCMCGAGPYQGYGGGDNQGFQGSYGGAPKQEASPYSRAPVTGGAGNFGGQGIPSSLLLWTAWPLTCACFWDHLLWWLGQTPVLCVVSHTGIVLHGGLHRAVVSRALETERYR